MIGFVKNAATTTSLGGTIAIAVKRQRPEVVEVNAETIEVEIAEAVAGIERVAITAHPGQQLSPWPEGGPYPGFVFARGETADEVERALHTAHRELTLVFEGG